ncbi:DeoR/GlpR family DNA-binding transcription regulator [Vibrio sp. ZSDZ65]|uniref:DeoR/GlpR family DNA-binding transcription regulator n=1 Tax=Vibrio qingdaonensis TaxID=2829491 RepID=A0A9X3CK24_9VIBR|nr:DeoR/GlpR family DNA-binding transcription regulator [Vibrio qingdaonensis]MCW8344807.1 DeoR/GlpR family DNA-binding transcription regulator [Vibrio qingdaonensis]
MRSRQIVELVNDQRSATVEEIAEAFNVSVETIRRDLKKLDESGALKRVHGGAVSVQEIDEGRSFHARAKDYLEEKELLVSKALDYIQEGMVIGLDASSSSWCLAREIPNISCTIITNSLQNVIALEGKNNINVICTGGSYSEKYSSFYGPLAVDTLANMSVDVCFFSCVGFDYDSGVWDSNEYNYQIKRSFIEISQQVILIADKSKYKKRSLLKICDSESVDVVITDL